ncbi:beta-mannosidase [Holotrichia oblita]|nr:beta-mannosidase [Holotrichia oblita]
MTRIALMAGSVYYATYVIGNADMTGILSIASIVPMIIGMFLGKPFINKLGMQKARNIGNFISLFGALLSAIYADNLTLVLVGMALLALGLGPVSATGLATLAYVADYGEWKHHVKLQGVTFSCNSIATKVGTGLGGAFIGWGLQVGGYVAGVAEQTSKTIFMIKGDIKKNEWIETTVPGTVFTTLRNHGFAPDPYYGGNEDAIQEIFTNDYEYIKKFQIEDIDLKADEILLVCEGIDTLADIYINNKLVAYTENMHRTYKFNVRDYLIAGTNEIRVVIYSAKNYVNERAQYSLLPSVLGNTGVERLRKAQCSFGWDWGLSLPDMGIWRSIYIECQSISKIENYYITQKHSADAVTLEIEVNLKTWTNKPMVLEVEITDPDGDNIYKKIDVEPGSETVRSTIEITNPKLWWYSGYGEHDKESSIGLRTITLKRENDEFGQSYEFIVNDKALFIRGSNLIIEDAVVTGYSKERTEKMLRDCVKANFNCVRVWGGALYPEDYFYDICDRMGLLVYQDFMFACHAYPATDEFIANISEEIKDNVERIRHHACLSLWCGNNEIETIIGLYLGNDPLLADLAEAVRKLFGFEKPDAKLEKKLKDEYLKIFDNVIPELLKSLDPNTCYTRSSPCSRDEAFHSFEKSFYTGDNHYYINAAGMIPYKEQRQYHFRFVSEMGFQSYPNMKTIKSFAEEGDLGPYTPIMFKHQKSGNGNKTIEHYMEREFRLPSDFGLYVYESQIMAEVVSWAGLDYYGRWKAQQYYSKRFYAPILLSVNENETKADIYVTNDTFDRLSGEIEWSLKDNKSNDIIGGKCDINVEPLIAKNCVQLDFGKLACDFNPNENYLEYTLRSDGKEIGFGTAIFVPAKEFVFVDPKISFVVEETDDDVAIDQAPSGKIKNYTPTASSYHFEENLRLELLKGEQDSEELQNKLHEQMENGEIIDGSAGWGDTATILPWTMYSIYGDDQIIHNQYSSAKKWVDYITANAKMTNPTLKQEPWYQNGDDAMYVWDTCFHFGEWLEPDFGADMDIGDDIDKSESLNILKNWMAQRVVTGDATLATAYYFYSASLMSKMAELLGNKEDQEHYEALSRRIKGVYNKYFIKEDGSILESRQAPLARALAFNLVNEDNKELVAHRLAQYVVDNGYHLNTGFLSTPFLLAALSRNGYVDTAFKLLEQKDSPSWLFQIENGATTVCERLDAYTPGKKPDLSCNHYAYGAVCDFLFSDIAGIRNLCPGYREFEIRPTLGGCLTWVSAEYDSPQGKIYSAWKIEGEDMLYTIQVPANSMAYAYIPADSNQELPSGAIFEAGTIKYTLGSGIHELKCKAVLNKNIKMTQYSKKIWFKSP